MSNTYSKKGKFGTTMGVTSIIAILVILVLIVFAALSYTTSKADYSLSKKAAETTSEYYAADSKAEDHTAEIAEAAKESGWQNSYKGKVTSISEKSDGTHVLFSESVGDAQELQVELLVAAGGKISRLKWQLVPSGKWNPDMDINVIK